MLMILSKLVKMITYSFVVIFEFKLWGSLIYTKFMI